MYEKIVEIIVYLMTELHNNHTINESTLKSLSIQGYTETEISAAFSWIADRTGYSEQFLDKIEGSAHSFRHLHDYERQFITVEVYGYLLQLFQLGVLNHDQIETVVERIMVAGMQPVDMTTVRHIVAALLFQSGVVFGKSHRLFIQGNDSIH